MFRKHKTSDHTKEMNWLFKVRSRLDVWHSIKTHMKDGKLKKIFYADIFPFVLSLRVYIYILFWCLSGKEYQKELFLT